MRGIRGGLVAPLVFWKAVLIAFALFSPAILPSFYNINNYRTNFVSPEHVRGRAAFLQTWDTQQYIHISVHGYDRSDPMGPAFWPLWPACIAAGRLIGLPTLVSAMILSNAFSLAGLLAFHALVADEKGSGVADLALAAQLAWPAAFFFLLPYSESLFFLLVVVLFLGLQRENVPLETASAFLLPLARAAGAFVLVPLAVDAWQKKSRRALLPVAGVIAGLLLYFGVMALAAGDPLAAFAGQAHYVTHPSLANLVDMPRFVHALVAPANVRAMSAALVDRALFVGYLALLPVVWKWNRTWFWLALVLGVIPAMTQTFASFSRYALVIFPIFAAAGGLLARCTPAWRAAILATAVALQIVLFVLHINNHWVA